MTQVDSAARPDESVAAEARQFDFWIGEWDLTWGEGQRGTNRIRATLDGQVVMEEFDGMPTAPFRGLSVSVYTPSIKAWRQTWVDNNGGYLDFSGGFAGDRMVLSRTAIEENPPVQQRMVWFNIAADSLDWQWERSEDGGATWTVQWAIHYARRPGSASSSK